jgi:hypothetical protein
MSTELVLRAPTREEITQAQLPARYETACAAIAECVRIDDLKDLADRQAALASYARQAQDDTLLTYAQRVQARALRRVGELLKQIEPARGANQNIQEGTLPKVTRESAATDAGLSEHQRKTALRVANLPQEEFEAAVESDRPPTVTELAERGMFARPISTAPPVTPADPRHAAQATDMLRQFAAFCGIHDPVRIACASGADVGALRSYVEVIDGWLDRFVTNLPREVA